MSRRQAPTAPRMLQGPPGPWPPTCPSCGFRGEPGPDATPYVACGGDPTRHQRRPVGLDGCRRTGQARGQGACLAGRSGGCDYCRVVAS